MRKGPTVALSGGLHSQLARHLLNGDGREAAAIVLCARVEHPRLKLLAQRVILVPHEACERHADHLVWPGSYLEEALDQAEEQDLSLLLVHSHPGGYFQFSELDDASDQEVFPALFLARASGRAGSLVHGSAIIVPGGAMRARVYDPHMRRTDVELTAVYGDDLRFYWGSDEHPVERRPMAFTSDMGDELKRLTRTRVGPLLSGLSPTEWSAGGNRLLAEFGGQDTSYAVAVNPKTGAERNLSPGNTETGFAGVALTPDAKTVLGYIGGYEGGGNSLRIASVPYTGGKPKVIVNGGFNPSWGG